MSLTEDEEEKFLNALGESSAVNTAFYCELLKFFKSSNERTLDEFSAQIEDSRVTEGVRFDNQFLYANGSRFDLEKELNPSKIISDRRFTEATRSLLKLIFDVIGNESFTDLVSEISDTVGTAVDKETLTKMIDYQKDAVDHLIASKVQQPVAGTSGLGSPIKMKKPSKRFASEKIIHL